MIMPFHQVYIKVSTNKIKNFITYFPKNICCSIQKVFHTRARRSVYTTQNYILTLFCLNFNCQTSMISSTTVVSITSHWKSFCIYNATPPPILLILLTLKKSYPSNTKLAPFSFVIHVPLMAIT